MEEKKQIIHITVCAVSVPALKGLEAFAREYQENYAYAQLDWNLFSAMRPFLTETEKTALSASIRQADIAVVDLMGASEAMAEIVQQALAACRGQRIVIGNHCRSLMRLGRFSMEKMTKQKTVEPSEPNTAASTNTLQARPETEKTQKQNAAGKMRMMRRLSLMFGSLTPAGMPADMKNLFRLIDYWQQAGRQDIFSFMYLLLRNYFGQKELPKPAPPSMRYGIYLKHPVTEKSMDSLTRYAREEKFDNHKPTVAVLSYGHRYPHDFLPLVRKFYEILQKDWNVLPIAFSQNVEKDLDTLEGYLLQKQYPVRMIVNLMPFRLGAGPMGGDAERAVSVLKRADVPYFKPFVLTRTDEPAYLRGNSLNPGEFLINLMLPELDGGIGTVPVGLASGGDGLQGLLPLEERMETTVLRMQAYLRLQTLPNNQKKLVLICYNYPPGEGSRFNAAFLDTFASISVLLSALKKAGYKTCEKSAEEIRHDLFSRGICNHPVWSDPSDAAYYDQNQAGVQGIAYGNVLIALQPLRSEADDVHAVHDRNLPPSENYRSFYQWIRTEYQADAILHIGTHGTLEFLPGRETAMSASCWPDRLIGTVPHFYLYYMGNPSEAMIARRRSHAVLIGYQPPRLTESALYGDCLELKALISEYNESLQSAPEKCDDLINAIEKKAQQAGFGISRKQMMDSEGKIGQVGQSPGMEGRIEQVVRSVDLEDLEEQLYHLEHAMIPDGLHIIGKADCGPSEEIEQLLNALEGRYVPVGKPGDVIKDRDMFPSGKNIVQFDPRKVPTQTAFFRGQKIAQNMLARYHAEHGIWPKSTAVILWGLETSRSQGETIGQIMEYLGLRLKADAGKFEDRFEILPTEELSHPRIDVVIQICGFFRDMFPNLIENLNVMLQKLAQLEENSAFAENTERLYRRLLENGYDKEDAHRLSASRIFGPAPGEYGTRLTELVRMGRWKEEQELSDLFTEDLSFVYTLQEQGSAQKALLLSQYETVEMITQIRSNAEYELTDLDHYYEFYGGLSKAVETVRGTQAALYVGDSTGSQVRTESLESALQRGLHARLLNPQWIEGMMRHGYHGAAQIEKRFENILGFAASTGCIPSQSFSALTKCYVQDEERKKQLQSANRWAYLSMLERLMEADHRQYWEASEEELDAIRQAYLETEGDVE